MRRIGGWGGVALIGAAMLAGCHINQSDPAGQGNVAVAHGFRPPDIRPATPVAGQAQMTPLTAYIGHYPADAVDGVAFFDRTEVAHALDEAVIDGKVRHVFMSQQGPQTPIFARREMIGSWGCEAHDCGDHNWTLFVNPQTRRGIACYHDVETMGNRSRWYQGGAPVWKPEACPSGDGGKGGDSEDAAPGADVSIGSAR